MIPGELRERIETTLRHRFGAETTIRDTRPVSGGCISSTAILVLSSGSSVFAKWHDSPPEAFFSREAEGLRALRQASPLRVPEVLGVLDNEALPHALLLEDLTRPEKAGITRPRPASRLFDEELGHGLAQQHRTSHQQFGFPTNNYIGTTPQNNDWCDDWPEFFRARRLEPLLQILDQQGRLDVRDRRLFNDLSSKLPDLIATDESPALLHGDLWSGNILIDGDGRPGLIDPAVYYGHREADTAYTRLFGGLSSRAMAAYNEAYPLTTGSDTRSDIYNLYHLLNHAVIFGGSYMAQAHAIASRYV